MRDDGTEAEGFAPEPEPPPVAGLAADVAAGMEDQPEPSDSEHAPPKEG